MNQTTPVTERVPRPWPGIASLPGLRVADILFVLFFAYTTGAALVCPLVLEQRLAVVALNLLACGLLFLLGRYGREERHRRLVTIHDWLPCVLVLLAYRESGLFFAPDPTHRLDYIFLRWDDILLKNRLVEGALGLLSPWLARYLEFSYLLCYPLVPLALGTLYVARWRNFAQAGRRAETGTSHWVVDHFWTAVLLGTLACYAIYPAFPLTPPRQLFADLPGPHGAPLLRGMNHWVLGNYAVGASLFPSAHVAAATAIALVMRRYWPRLGVLFTVIVLSIMAATVYGRYHYAADALAGAVVGLAAYLISNRIRKA